ncbi:MAG: DUF3303 family protein [Pseudomonadota bacterium]
MLYMVIERFKDGDARPAYRRFRDKGRMLPKGLAYVNSWTTEDFATCYQVMECAERALLDQWIAAWQDIVDFEVHPVLASKEAAAEIAPKLD